MSDIIEAGNRGPKVKGDCYVTYDPHQGGSVEVVVQSEVKPPYGESIRSLAQQILEFYSIKKGCLHIEDFEAMDFVLAARIEACIKKTISTDINYLPEMISKNNDGSSKKRLRLSRLYLPGNTPKMMIKAGSYQPHSVILDLEDAVSVTKKDEARLLVRNALRQVDFCGAERMVRINQLPLGLTDLEQIVPHGVQVILIPKCESAEEIDRVNDKIAGIQAEISASNEIFLMPIIESCRGILNAEQIAEAANNIVALAIGLEDYTADLGVTRTQEGVESLYARSHLVNVCKASGIQAMDSVFSDVGNVEALKQTVIQSKTLGFTGMGCIHPRQIPVIHEHFAPTAEEIEKAKKIVAAFEKAEEKGLGVISLGTKMIDPPVVEKAQQTITSAIRLGRLSKDWETQNR